MKVIRADFAGFCFGVRRAYDLANAAIQNFDEVQTFGDLIHNPEVLEELNARGIRSISAISKIKKGTIIIRAHGISQKKLTALQKKKVQIVDASCPFVRKIHAAVAKFVAQKIPVFIFGSKQHPELTAIFEDFPAATAVKKFNPKFFKRFVGKKIGLLAQTTERSEKFLEFKNSLEKLGVKVLAQNTICGATRERQNSASALAKRVDVMVIIGGKKSNNSKQLFDLVKNITKSFWIESEKDLQKDWFRGCQKVGISAGASTPEKVILRVSQELKKL
ncbi:4-hydroxy-3-methylbut-2-enyl diphosphate reductase [Candidatus Gracilibacteria bacterium]|nr:4-hydroxy-3-methylbut-2-enyl diphosphate reductase [Candidatus Gracilibacteria bacterium]MCF7856735.1 4-hydroxy-3-methylbut-2-enyl diphosphate reductase [Candidatus Gracilibacteria bacterium]MCF7896943.1 4-hydroxy-3-methylbut-2-enyl diphosphate reductase [Candidatus Gracilibacteria bacterium]